MHAGQIVESGRTLDILRNPLHPFSQVLKRLSPQRSLKDEQ